MHPSTLLIVDDDPVLRECVGDVAVTAGYRVHLAGSGEQALELASRRRVDASILDVHMPGLDGIETARALRRLHRELPVVFLTASPSREDRRRGAALPCFAWLAKPVTPAVLRRVLERLDRAVRRN